ncbi:unnamed protein product [Schistosoma margrebowiei]|uniref:Uncharacterized protein n=1 Tax=Schistosoma margrebowiei TaxID=48269 RepID=A0A183M9H4_9TREM|nr:unnamed protein product [Schistosoma margrebowiei]
MQMKTASVAAVSASVGLIIHKGKTKVLKFKAENNNPITLDGETLEDIESFTYLGSIIDEQGGSDADVKARIGKARTAFLQLKNTWNSKQLSTNIKVIISNTNVKAVLLYGAETWRTTTTTIKKVQVIINSCRAIAFCGREQTNFQLKKKLGKDDGNGEDIQYANRQTASRGKP